MLENENGKQLQWPQPHAALAFMVGALYVAPATPLAVGLEYTINEFSNFSPRFDGD